MMQSLAREAQPYHPLMLSQAASTDVRYKLAILETLRTKGSNSPARTVRHCHISTQRGRDTVNQLIAQGLIDCLPLEAGRKWISINEKGVEALEAWYIFANAINGEEAA